jgi:hypothetical protein
VLNLIRESANQYRATLERNEAATRAVLIDPVLRALGWDIANTNMVEVEKALDKARADYALYDNNAAVCVIIEAKSLGTDLNRPDLIMSLVNYAFTFKLQDIFLTDGMVWHHFTNFQPGNVRVERSLDIATGDPVENAAYLVQRLDAAKFWPKEETIDKLAQQVTQLESSIATLQKEVANLKAISLPFKSDAVKETHQPGIFPSSNYIELNQTDNLAGKRPSCLRLPDGTEIPVRRWKDVLRESCKFALASNPKIAIPFRDRAGRKVWLFNTVKPATGVSYISEQYNGQTIFVYMNYDANNCVSNALHVLDQVPLNYRKMTAAVAIEDE